MTRFHFIEKSPTVLSGTSFDVGIQHGEIYKDKIHTSLETYEKMFWNYSQLTWQEACNRAEKHIDSIKKYNENYLWEMEGIAKGASLNFTDILALNSRSELTLVSSIDGCTAFYLINASDSTAWLGQNWDWKSSQKNSIINISIEQENLPKINMITEAGIIGKIGCNSTGIGVCLNALATDAWKPNVPIHFGLRSILESFTLDEARSKVENNIMASAAHFLIGSREGESISAEVSPEYTAINKLESKYLTHTNHICSHKLKEMVKEVTKDDSYNRLNSINSIVAKLMEKTVTEKELFNMLSNHENYPDSICRHESQEQPEAERMETVFSIVMNLSEPKLYWIHGKPCENKEVGFQNV